ncbi:flagellar motor protein MotB [Curtobacterium sp. MCBD17_035]|uniref:OmpA/MotB family protein n=1 Tax=unclassified Curtobacterium TaxID=257496 RepID=UPI0021AC5004|nr:MULTISPECIES: flagellar motor protein MotB [unclassified Curtobacterium]WIB68889.1 flagellar motor protein MotB [Curtobacterium sp. MCBD17_035]
MAGRGRGRRGHGGGGHDDDDHPDERWMASYMDMITVLMCMFLVLFAMSQVDQQKFIALKDSLATGFGQVQKQKVDTASGTVVKPDEVTKKDGKGYALSKSDAEHSSAASGTANSNADGTSADPSAVAVPAAAPTPNTAVAKASKADVEAAKKELDDLKAIEAAIKKNLTAEGKTANVQFDLDARGLTVRLVGSETYFATNSADLSDEARAVMDAIAPVLKSSGHDISVEGHADQRNSTAPYATNWELSAARATGVLRDLVERGGLPADHVQSVGFGSSRPLSKGSTDADLALNRRVDIVVLSNQDQDVSALMPAIAAAQDAAHRGETAGTTAPTTAEGDG